MKKQIRGTYASLQIQKRNWNEISYNDIFEEFEYMTNSILQCLLDTSVCWCGHVKLAHRALTPSRLEYLFHDADYCLSEYLKLAASIDEASAWMTDNPDMGLAQVAENLWGFIEEIDKYEFEMILMRTIIKSYEFSTKKSQGARGVLDIQSWVEDYGKDWLDFFMPITVTPWKMPEAPPLVVPEKPRLVLKVSKLHECMPRINVSLDDIFLQKCLASEVLVDEEVQLGDKVVVKTTGWDKENDVLIKVEYDGLADAECPCSTYENCMEVKYDFDESAERRKHEMQWESAWLNKHFDVRTHDEIQKIGSQTHRICDSSLRLGSNSLYSAIQSKNFSDWDDGSYYYDYDSYRSYSDEYV